MYLSLLLFIIGVLGFVLNRRNLILMLISIEIMLLAITYLILVSSVSFDDILGQTYAIYIISIAGAETAIGLGIFVAFYRLRGSVVLDDEIEYSGPSLRSSRPSPKIGVRKYSTVAKPVANLSLDPWGILLTGLIYFYFGARLRRLKINQYIYIDDAEAVVTKINEAFFLDKIIPFFDVHTIKGNKALNYQDLKKIAYLIRDKEHLASDGKVLKQILQVKSGMNRLRGTVEIEYID
jgi:NADH-ubiquinone oxidoreductase chain 4L